MTVLYDAATLGELKDALWYYDNNLILNVELTGEWYSYRGYYYQLAIDYKSGGQEHSTVGHLKDIIEDALKVGRMEGYKGGEFSIDDGTIICFCEAPNHTQGLYVNSITKSFDGVDLNVMEED